MRTQLDQVGRQRVYGLHGDARSGLPSIADLLTQQPADRRDVVDRDQGAGDRRADRRLRASGRRSPTARSGSSCSTRSRTRRARLAGLPRRPQDRHDLVRRVRFYLTSKASADDRDVIQRAAEREFRLLQGIHHPGIAHATDLVDHEFGPAVIFEHDPDSVRLDHWLAEHGDQLTMDQRLDLVRDLAETMQYAHSRHLVHRSLNPRSILVCDPDQPRPRLVVTDWQTGGRVGTSTSQSTLLGGTVHGDQLADDVSRLYQAPEAGHEPGRPGHLLDVFALGALAYLIVTGQPPRRSAARADRRPSPRSAACSSAPPPTASRPCLTTWSPTRPWATPPTVPQSVTQFLEHLDEVEDELTAPEPAAAGRSVGGARRRGARRRAGRGAPARLRRHRDRPPRPAGGRRPAAGAQGGPGRGQTAAAAG